MQQKSKKAMLATLWIICLTTSLIMYLGNANNVANLSNNNNNNDAPLVPMASTNPNAPDQLYEAAQTNETYNFSSTSYYYYCSGLPIYYALFWLYTVSNSNNFDLYLYSDSSYSNLVGASNATNQLDWIVYRPPALTILYPRSYTFTGSGEAYIQYEFGEDINVNSPHPLSLEYVEYAKLYEIALSSLTTYTVFLDVSAGSDYDLYIFRTPSGSAIRYDSHNSTSTSTGQYERIVFTPLYNETYAIVITKTSGGGAATLTVYDYIYVPTPDQIPTFELFPALLALTANFGLYLTTLKKKNPILQSLFLQR